MITKELNTAEEIKEKVNKLIEILQYAASNVRRKQITDICNTSYYPINFRLKNAEKMKARRVWQKP